MGKIKITVTSGNVVEKPLLTCFKGNNGDYLVFDNETIRTMDYPVIGISKFNGSSLEKIYDQNEWGSVKENLKSIISGNQMEYLSVPDTLTAQDDFFTQLTLPTQSFDILKNAYAPKVEEPVVASPVEVQTPVENAEPTVPDPMAIFTTPLPPVNEVPTTNISAIPESTPEVPVQNETVISSTPEVPNISNEQAPVSIPEQPAFVTPEIPTAPAAFDAPVEPASISMPEAPTFITPELPEPPVAPAPMDFSSPIQPDAEVPMPEIPTEVAPIQEESKDIDVAALKAEFMEACGNMFDALIKKINK